MKNRIINRSLRSISGIFYILDGIFLLISLGFFDLKSSYVFSKFRYYVWEKQAGKEIPLYKEWR